MPAFDSSGNEKLALDLQKVGGNAVNTGSGNAAAGTQRVILATDQPAVPVSGTFWQSTQPVSIAGTVAISAVSLPLPTGAATAAKQPALGTAGSASADVITVQGIASMTPIKTDGSGVTQPVSDGGGSLTVDGTVTASLSSSTNAGATAKTLDYDSGAGTDTVTGFGILLPKSGGAVAGGTSSDPIRTDPTGTTTQPVSATSLPLPTGAATAAKQPALGTAGSASADVITVQGIASMTPIKTDGSAVTQPVSDGGGSLTVDGTVTASLSSSTNAGATAKTTDYDTGAGTDTVTMFGLALPKSGGAVAGGTSSDPIRTDPTGTTAQPVTDNGGSLTVDGSVSIGSALPAGTNYVGKTRLTDGTNDVTLKNLTNAKAVPTAIVDGNGDQITSFGGGTQYTEGDTDSTITGTAVLWEDAGDTLTPVSAAKPLPVNIISGAGSGGTAMTDDAAFTPGSTSITPVGGTYRSSRDSVDDNDAGALAMTQKRALLTCLETPNGDSAMDDTNDAVKTVLSTALPAGNNNIGDVDVASLPAATNAGATAKTADYDSGAGTDTVTMFGIAIPKSGGAVAGGTSSDPIRTDPTGTTTQPVSATSLPLPTGAATAAKQPALGTAGSASADVITVQGIASMTPIKTDGSAVTQPVSDGGGSLTVDGTVTASLSSSTNAGATAKTLDYDSGAGTDTVTGFGILLPKSGGAVAGGTSSDPVRIDPTGTTTQPISAASLPLPSGAATAAKQPALGTAGSASSDVITVQGIASMTALKVDGSAVTQPVSISGNQAVNVAQVNGSTVSTAATGVQKVGLVGNAGATVDSAIGAGTAPTNQVVVGQIYNTTAPAPTNGQAMAMQSDQAGNHLVAPGMATATLSPWNSGTSLNATQTIFTHAGVPAVLVQLTQTTTLTAGAVTFEVTFDGSNWSTISADAVIDPTSTTQATISLPYTVQASTNKTFLLLMKGAQGLRAKLSTQITGSGTVTPNYALIAYPGVQQTILGAGSATIGSLAANQSVNVAQLAGTTTDTNSGNKSAGTLRVVLATDQPQLTNKLLVTPDANSAINVAQVGGNSVNTGTGNAGTGTARVVLASDQPVVATGGNVAHDGVDSGNPVKQGFKAINAEVTAVANADRVDGVADLTGKQIILPYANPENFIAGKTSDITGTSDTAVIAAQGAGVRIYVAQIIVTNSHASTGTWVNIKDGSTTIYTGYAAAAGGGFVINFPVPLRLTANTALNAANETTSSNTRVSASGYKGA